MTVFITDSEFSYNVNDAIRDSFTVEEFLEYLQQRGAYSDSKIVIRCDGGYSYRAVNEYSVKV